MKNIILSCLLSLVVTIICGFVTIPFLRRLKAGQTVLKYVKEHKNKNGTPTMGGLFFIVPSAIMAIFFCGFGRLSSVAIAIGLAFMIVGFIDDYIKIRFKKNEGLKAYQKILFQLSIALLSGFYCFYNGITTFYLPFVNSSVNLGWITIPLVTIIFVATTNCVNLTDGLDGLAGSVSAVYFLFISIIIMLQITFNNYLYAKSEECLRLCILSVSLIGGLCGFLLFNTNKASVFMGDTGSLSLGGFIGAISVFSSNSFFIPIIGIMFVVSGISVIMQVLYFKKTKKRIFLMSPLHHHFQIKGYSESKISFCYSLITCCAGIVSVISYL